MKKIISGIVLALVAFQAQAYCYSDGIRTGVVQKFSKKGYVIRNWEGELVMEGNKFNQASGGNIWKFSVNDAAIAQKIEDATMNAKSVSLKYCQVFIQMGTTDTDYRITDVVTH